MSTRFLRAAISLSAVFAAYGAYAITAVPMIDPPASHARAGAEGQTLSPLGPLASADDDPSMLVWFPQTDAWERQRPKRLRNEQGIVLFQQLTNLGEGKIKLKPCSIVFLPKEKDLDRESRDRQAVILQSPDGAILRFDRPVSLRRGGVGNLEGGTLLGRISIRSDGKSPAADDDLLVTTHDVKLTQTTITTPHDVKFRQGPNRGHGRGLLIKITPPEKQGKAAAQFKGLRSFTLKENVEMTLEVKDRDKQDGDDSPPPAAEEESPREFSLEQPVVVGRGGPVHVVCQGPFRYDFRRHLATFDQKVNVQRHDLNGGPSDKLTCEHLALHMTRRKRPPKSKAPGGAAEKAPAKKRKKSAAGKSDGSFPKMELERLVATGAPVVLESPASRIYARGQRLEYHLPTRRVSLESSKEGVIFREKDNEIHARQLHYQPGPDGRLGRFQAVGAGWLNWAVEDKKKREASGQAGAPTAAAKASTKPPQRFEASWTRQLHSGPHEGRQVISMEGAAKARVNGTGALEADEIHVWLYERLKPEKAEPAKMNAADQRKKPRFELVPDRMMARSSVKVASPQLTGHTDKLEIWFHHPPAAEPASSNASQSVSSAVRRPQPQGPAANSGGLPGLSSPARPEADSGRPKQRFNATGKLVQVQLVQVQGQQPRLSQLDIYGDAWLKETLTAKPEDRPLLIKGESVHVVQKQPGEAVMSVVGQPGYVEGRGLSLKGAAVNLDQRTNKVWIDGPGAMTLLVDRDLEGKQVARPRPLEINWQGKMTFDGQRAVFEKSIVVRREQEQLNTETLEAVLDQKVVFSQLKKQNRTRPRIARISCREDVFLRRQVPGSQGMAALEEVQAMDLAIDQISGAINASGPGWVKRVARRDGSEDFALPGMTPSQPPAQPDPKEQQGLSYLHVEFQQAIRGNLHQNVMAFVGQVQATYGAVQTWRDLIDPDRPENFGPRGAVLRCDELQLTQMPGPGDTKFVEILATEDVVVEGQTFTANALRMTYSQAKEKLILQGTDRTPAILWRQLRIGSPRSKLMARKIHYWRKTNRVKLEGAYLLDAIQTPQEQRAGKKRDGRR